ncbi:MAG: BolA/IbaG family iron-sulfur metabolism protein, partial [Hydrogenophaga sp.]|nr:BolA/IbaG family iron-sulfur metabolism protein [Hydrogenophaga sp.]
MTADQLQQLIAAGMPCEHLEVTGDGRHWAAVIVSPAFEGMRAIARHKRVYATLGERIQSDEVRDRAALQQLAVARQHDAAVVRGNRHDG